MELYAINGNPDVPEGYVPESVKAQGSYLQVHYVYRKPPTETAMTWLIIDVYVNNMGREVLRTTHEQIHPIYPEDLTQPVYTLPPEPKHETILGMLIDGIKEGLKYFRP